MNCFKVHIILVLSLGLIINANAQNAGAVNDTTIKSATIEIVHKYKAEVRQAPKPEYTATMPPTDTTLPHFNYIVPQQSLLYTYSSPPLNPLALGVDSSNMERANYIKLGGGNLSTIYVDGTLNQLKFKSFTTDIHLHQFSQESSLKNQQWASTGLSLNGVLMGKLNQWQTSLDLDRNQYHYYGYDHNLYNPTNDSVTQTFYSLNASAQLKNTLETFWHIKYGSSISFSYLKDSHNASENTIQYILPASRALDSAMVLLGQFKLLLSDFSNPDQNSTNTIFQLSGGFNYNLNHWKFHAVLSPTVGKDGVYLLPDLNASSYIGNSNYYLTLGWHGNLLANSFRDFTSINPYIFNNYSTKQTHTEEYFAQVNSTYGNHLNYGAALSWWQLGNLPQYFNDYLTDAKQFYMSYLDKANATSLNLYASYAIANYLALGVNAAYNGYSASGADVLNMPAFSLNGNITIRPTNKLICIAYLNQWSGVKALGSDLKVATMPAYLNLGVNFEYAFFNRLSAFLQMDNLLNNKNQVWQGYDSFGLNLYLGVRLKF